MYSTNNKASTQQLLCLQTYACNKLTLLLVGPQVRLIFRLPLNSFHDLNVTV